MFWGKRPGLPDTVSLKGPGLPDAVCLKGPWVKSSALSHLISLWNGSISLCKVQNIAAGLVLRAPCHQNCTPLLQQLHWLPISERIKYKTACMCYNAITGSAPSYLSERLHLYTPCFSSDIRMLKLQRFNDKTHGFRTFSHFGLHIWNNLPQDTRHSLFLQSQTQDISLLRIFQLSNIVLHPYQSVQCVCTCAHACVCWFVCTCTFCIVVLKPLSPFRVSFFLFFSFLNIQTYFITDNISILMYIVCYTMLVQRFELQGRRFTSFHYYYY